MDVFLCRLFSLSSLTIVPMKPYTLSSRMVICVINDFDFVCRCDCDGHHTYPNILAISGFMIIFPAIYFWVCGMYFFSVISASSALSSVVYHSFHHPYVKFVDVILAYVLAFTGTIKLMQSTLQRHSIVGLIGLLQITVIIFINNSTSCRSGDKTILSYHFLLHLLSVSSLICLCVASNQ